MPHRTTSLILAALALAYMITDATARKPILDDGTKCSNLNPNIVNAIGKFCQYTDIYVPSPRATNGMFSDNMRVSINITGSCNPPQYVPQSICLSQFYYICSISNQVHGDIQYKYGWKDDKCQNWQIKTYYAKYDPHD